jgi:hypothetical protein
MKCRTHFGPELEGRYTLEYLKTGLDVVLYIGSFTGTLTKSGVSFADLHSRLRERGIPISRRTVYALHQRYEKLITPLAGNRDVIETIVNKQRQAIIDVMFFRNDALAVPYWIIREWTSGVFLGVVNAYISKDATLFAALKEVCKAITVPVTGYVTDGSRTAEEIISRRFLERNVPREHIIAVPHTLTSVAKFSWDTGMKPL